MRTSLSIGMSVAAPAVFTHGVVLSAMAFNEPLPLSTYQGFFWHIVLATERLWSWAHGWQPLSHIRDFGQFFAPAVHLICPLIGFALFRIFSRRQVGIHLWKPLAIALLLAIPNGFIGLVPGYALPWVEAARTILVVLSMVWSVGALRVTGGRPHASSTESPATA